MIDVILLLIGFVPLIYGADMLVDNSSSLAQKLNIPAIVIGLTIVAFGTSAPELVVNVLASLNRNSELTLGNIIGSNIVNVLVILGVTAIIHPLFVKRNTLRIEIPLSLFSAVILLFMANDQVFISQHSSIITRSDGVVLLLCFLLFMGYNVRLTRKGKFLSEVEVKEQSVSKSFLFIVLGLLLLVSGGKLIVMSAEKVALMLGISQRIIGLTVVAIGTSLPELATSLIAARKKSTDIAIGNIIGSNVFNVFLVLGVSAVINPLSIDSNANYDLMFNVFVSSVLLLAVLTNKQNRLYRTAGILFVIIYLIYTALLIF